MILGADVVAILALLGMSWVGGMVYMAGCLAALVALLYSCCSNCSCRSRCDQMLPGKLLMAFIHPQSSPYSRGQLAVSGLALVWLIGLPQVWLWQSVGPLAIFWVMMIIALGEIRTDVCQGRDGPVCSSRLQASSLPIIQSYRPGCGPGLPH